MSINCRVKTLPLRKSIQIMRNTIITASFFATAMALNSGSSFGADIVNRYSTDAMQQGSQAIVGKLVSLRDYLGRDHQGTSSNSTANAFSSPTTSGSDVQQLGSQTGRPGSLSGARNDTSTSSPRNQQNPQASKATDRSDSSLHESARRDSPYEQTFVLIAQQGAWRGAQTSTLGSTNRTLGQTTDGRFGSDQRNFTGSSATASSGHAYILVFGDDASGQSAYLKAKGMIRQNGSNWATSSSDAGDRIPVRGQEDGNSAATRDVLRTQQAEETTIEGRAGQRDSEGKWSKAGSQVRVTGVLLDRGGIQAIRVSEIAMDNLLSDPAGKGTGDLDRSRPSFNGDRKPETDEKRRE